MATEEAVDVFERQLALWAEDPRAELISARLRETNRIAKLGGSAGMYLTAVFTPGLNACELWKLSKPEAVCATYLSVMWMMTEACAAILAGEVADGTQPGP